MAAVPARQKHHLSGRRFGRLLVLREAEPRLNRHGRPVRRWLCRCDCGRERLASTTNLVAGHTRSCGPCLRMVFGRRPAVSGS